MNKSKTPRHIVYEGDQSCFEFYSPLNPEDKLADITGIVREVVAAHYLVTLKDLNRKRRSRKYVEPRQAAMYLCRKLTHYSLPDLAEVFEREHATVLHGIHAVNNRIETEPEFRGLIERLGKQAEMRIEAARRG